VLYYDNQSAIHLSKNSTFHSRSKHIDVKCHWIHDALEDKLLQIEKIYTDDNGSNMMTKLLSTQKLEICKSGGAPHIIRRGRIVGVVPLYVGTNPRGKPQRVSTLCEQYERKSTLCLWVHVRKHK
jgi:hypothetical protein